MSYSHHQPFPFRNKAAGAIMECWDDCAISTFAEAMALSAGGGSLTSSGQVSGHTNTLGWKNFKQDNEESLSLKEALFEIPKFAGLKHEFPKVYQALLELAQKKVYDGTEESKRRAKRQIVAKLQGWGLRLIDYGAARMAFTLTPDFVLKVTFGSMKQTKQEIEKAACAAQYPEFYAQIVDADLENYDWLVVEKLEQPGVEVFRRWLVNNTGVTELLQQNDKLHIKPEDVFTSISDLFQDANQEWFRKFYHAANHCGIEFWDLGYANWGMRKNGDWVVLDYGF